MALGLGWNALNSNDPMTTPSVDWMTLRMGGAPPLRTCYGASSLMCYVRLSRYNLGALQVQYLIQNKVPLVGINLTHFFERFVEPHSSFLCSGVAEFSVFIAGFLGLDFFAVHSMLNQLAFLE